MLFSSVEFLFFFLPLVLLTYLGIARLGSRRMVVGWLVLASLFFYGWWNPPYLLLIIGSMVFNFGIGRFLQRESPSLPILTAGVAANLGMLVYFKYAEFFFGTVGALASELYGFEQIALPLGISFFTFQQIAFLVDTYRGESRESDPLHYALFVSFFPQLVAGPIVHHKEILPQFARRDVMAPRWENFAVGSSMLILGLFKKVVIADGLAEYANPVFSLAETGASISFVDAWGAALAYSLQIYFDFSAYSEMAMGLARFFGVRLPVNFDAPYRSSSIIDFWRRWHRTLSRFLRDYVYISLGGNRLGPARRYVNLMATMLLGGLWHGAGWTFVAWGGIHGFYLLINHAWRSWAPRTHGEESGVIATAGYRALTFISVVLAWVLFRAESMPGALGIYTGIAGFNGLFSPVATLSTQERDDSAAAAPFEDPVAAVAILSALLVVWFMPSVPELMRRFDPGLDWEARFNTSTLRMEWKPSLPWFAVLALLFAISFYKMLVRGYQEFIYWSF